jgi:catechol 2,3-dioxygenase-like lactoylglutathione lyase family enzyme
MAVTEPTIVPVVGEDRVVSVDVENVNVVFACPGNTKDSYGREGRALASFYADLLGMRITREDWFMIAKEDRPGTLHLAFGDGPVDYQPPRWPDPEHPQQLHLDLPVHDLDAAEDWATSCVGQVCCGVGSGSVGDRGEGGHAPGFEAGDRFA